MRDSESSLIAANVRGYRRLARRYERLHGEIFNDREQARLRETLAEALDALEPRGPSPRVLDFGCGSGNVTRHLLELGAMVIAADVSPAFLSMITRAFPTPNLQTRQLNGRDLTGLPDASVDLAVAYSVLHHVPDYLRAVAELCRVVRPGGLVLIDHEAGPREYDPDPPLVAFRAAVEQHQRRRPKSARRFLDPSHYGTLGRYYLLHLRRRLGDPRYWPEGDIHVWPDDRIEWERVEQTAQACGLAVVERKDYLLYRRGVPEDLYETYLDRTADTRMLLLRRQ